MVGYLQGKVLSFHDGELLLGVGDPSFGVIGYTLKIPQRSDYLEVIKNQKVELYVYSHVREDAFDLYGFRTVEEKETFLMLLSVSGIGPKAALAVLSLAKPCDLFFAIQNGDQAFFKGVRGIGKKSAERILVDLKDQVEKKLKNSLFSNLAVKEDVALNQNPMGHKVFDAKQALLGLGYRSSELDTLLQKIVKKDQEFESSEQILREALKELKTL